MPYGYLGQNTPNQTVSNSGVFSINDVSDLEKQGKFGGSLEYVASGSETNVSTVDILNINESIYDTHLIYFWGTRPLTNDTYLQLRFYEDLSGSQTLRTSGNYDYGMRYRLGTTTGNQLGASQTSILMSNNIGNTDIYSCNGYFWLHNAGDNSTSTDVYLVNSHLYRTTANEMYITGTGMMDLKSVVNGIQFKFATGNITMQYKIFGIKKLI